MRFTVGWRSDVGRGRPQNEDRYLVDRDHGLYAVADGMGGHRAGEVASATAIETLESAFAGGRALEEAVEEANRAVFAKAADDPALLGMGTTLTAVTLDGERTALLGHVGDSRAYLMRDGAGTQVTDDHSLVEQLIREGRITPDEARTHPQRAIITRALGVEPDVEVDIYRIDLRPGDRLLICSDGLTNMVSDEALSATLRRHADPQQAADTLVDMANQAGGDDNITVVILDALGDAPAPGPVPQDATGELREAPPEVVAPRAPGGPPARQPSPAIPRRRPQGRFRGVTIWGLPIVFVVAVATGAVGWYARRTYYVGLSADRVTLFKGVPGGLLGWDPTVEGRTDLTPADLTPADRADLEHGHRFSSRSAAGRFLDRLQQVHDAAAGTTDPGITDPGITDPGTTDPGTTDPGTTDPGTTDPGTTDPGTTDPGPGGTAGTEPAIAPPGERIAPPQTGTTR